MGITITRRGTQARFDANRVAAVIKGLAPGMILERTAKGIDANGQQFAPYSKRYKERLRLMGESPQIDLRLSGGLLNSVKARGTTLRPNAVEVIIAPDTGTSPVWAPKAGGQARYDRAMRKFEKASARGDYSTHVAGRQASRAFRSRRTGKQSPPHNIVGYWLHYGTPTMKARPWMGLTDAQYTELVREIAKICFR